MGSKSNYLEDKILEHVLRNVAYSSPATVYLALYTVNPTDSTAGTEVSGGSYARQAITFGAPSPVGTIKNSAQVTFPVATADWGDVTGFAIMDNVAGGNMLYWSAFAATKTILSGDQLKVAANAIVITED